uniref:DH domain-containing protein n=1 Tax=Anopheles dirus TaxID=7168 RepID=A0A182N154_9DIPT
MARRFETRPQDSLLEERLPVACYTPLKWPSAKRIVLEPLPEDAGDHRRMRWYGLEQFITHEQNYLESLHKLQYELYNPLLLDESVVRREVSHAIFGTHRQLCRLHQHYSVLLETCAGHCSARDRLGYLVWAMLEVPLFEQLYTTYTINYRRMVAIFDDERRHNPPFARFVQARLDAFGERLTFVEYFVKPVQRVPNLLTEIRALLHHTPGDHPDCAVLRRCRTRIEQIATQINLLQGRSEMVPLVLSTLERRRLLHGTGKDRPRHVRLLHSALLEESVLRAGVRLRRQRLVALLSDRLVCLKLARDYLHVADAELVLQAGRFKSVKWVVPLQQLKYGLYSHATLGQAVGSKDVVRYINDYETLAQIQLAVGALHGEYDTLNRTVVTELMETIRCTVLRQERVPTALLFVTPVARTKPTRTLVLDDVCTRREWQHRIRMAQLALRATNSPAWWNSSMPATHVRSDPLFVRTFTAHAFRSQLWKVSSVTAGCCYAPCTDSAAYAQQLLRAWSQDINVLWLSARDGHGNSVVTLLTHHRPTNQIDERAAIPLERVTITSVAHVPVGRVGAGPPDTVWLAAADQLLIYAATYPVVRAPLAQVPLAGAHRRLLHHRRHVYVGGLGGRLTIFRLDAAGAWLLDAPDTRELPGGPIRAMLAVGERVYVAAGSELHVFAADRLVRTFEVVPSGEDQATAVRLLAHSVHGLWVVRAESRVASLYDAASHRHRLDINVTEHVMRFLGEYEQPGVVEALFPGMLTITALLVAADHLWIGTNVGLVLGMRLPRSANVPVLAHHTLVAYHAHMQDVGVLLAAPSLRPPPPAPTPTAEDTEPALLVGALPSQDMRQRGDLPPELPDTAPQPAPDDAGPNAAGPTGEGAPNSMLIVTGGRGYVNWRGQDVEQRASAEPATKPLPLFITRTPDASLKLKRVEQNDDNHANIMVWEQPLI